MNRNSNVLFDKDLSENSYQLLEKGIGKKVAGYPLQHLTADLGNSLDKRLDSDLNYHLAKDADNGLEELLSKDLIKKKKKRKKINLNY